MKKIINKLYAFLKEYYFDIIFIAVMLFIFFYDTPYLIYHPGSAINISSRINNGNDINGTYYINSVNVTKGKIPSLLVSFFIKDWDLVKIEDQVIENTNYDTTLKLEKVEMENTIEVAKFVACQKTNCSYKVNNGENVVLYIEPHSNTNVKLFDIVLKINGADYSYDNLVSYISSKNIGDKIDIEVESDGKIQTKYAYVYEYEGRKVIGLSVYNKIWISTEPSVDIDDANNEYGASGGLMYSLAIYDFLSTEDLARGRKIMGTGTINEEGIVGQIGGVKYKMLGANKNKADIFFIPESNFEEAKKVYDDYNLKFNLVMVKTLDDAINYLKET